MGGLEGIGRGAACGNSGRLPLPNRLGLWSALGSRAPGEASFESRYDPGLLAYFESRKPPPCA
jgi:hypothetical protein